VRKEKPYEVPEFAANGDKPLIYVSFGSLGSGDTELLKRIIAVMGTLPYRALVNVGDYMDQYESVPPNVIIDKWFPQPSVIPQVDAVIHHGGNNSFNEALFFGKPAIIMPFCWDGLDNAARIHDTGYGDQLPRYTWTDEQLSGMIARLIADQGMAKRLGEVAKHMQSAKGTIKAANILAEVATTGSYKP